ncbi:hypothetical protein ACEPAI_4468 [Sanghuangporus weigelae]
MIVLLGILAVVVCSIATIYRAGQDEKHEMGGTSSTSPNDSSAQVPPVPPATNAKATPKLPYTTEEKRAILRNTIISSEAPPNVPFKPNAEIGEKPINHEQVSIPDIAFVIFLEN